MSPPPKDEADARDAILALEALRCRLLGAGDIAALAELLHPDYLHVHGNGRATDKAATLARLGTQPRRTERGPLMLRTWGDAALLVGEQINRLAATDLPPGAPERQTRGMVTQTLRRENGGWRFLSLQFTPIADG